MKPKKVTEHTYVSLSKALKMLDMEIRYLKKSNAFPAKTPDAHARKAILLGKIEELERVKWKLVQVEDGTYRIGRRGK